MLMAVATSRAASAATSSQWGPRLAEGVGPRRGGVPGDAKPVAAAAPGRVGEHLPHGQVARASDGGQKRQGGEDQQSPGDGGADLVADAGKVQRLPADQVIGA